MSSSLRLLFRRFSVIGAVVLVVSVASLLYLSHRNDSNGIVSIAENHNVSLSRIIDEKALPWIDDLLEARRMGLGFDGSDPAVRAIDAAIVPWLGVDGLVALSIYDADGVVLYATDPHQIGRPGSDAAFAAKALAGGAPVSVLRAGQPLPDTVSGKTVEGVASFLPEPARADRPAFVVALTSDVTRLTAAVRHSSYELAIIIILVFIGAYLALLLVVGRAQDSLIDHRQTLARKAAKVRARARALHNEAGIREQTAQALRDSEDRFRAMTESASEWYWETGTDGRLSYVSERFCEVAGVSIDQIAGKAFADLATDEDLRSNPRKWLFHKATMRSHRPFRDFRVDLRFGDGSAQAVDFSGAPAFDEDDGFLGYRGTGRRVTSEEEDRLQLRALETRLANAISSISEGFVLFDAEDRLVLCNDRFKETYPLVADLLSPGVTFEEILRVATLRGQFRDQPRDFESWIGDRLARFRAPTGKGFLEHMSDGRWILVKERATENGGVVSIQADVTELRNTQDALEQANADLERRVEERTRSLALEVRQRRLTEAALRESEARLRTTVSNAPVVMFALDADGVFTVSEGAGLQALGLAPGEVVGRSAFDVYADRPVVLDAIRTCLAGLPASYEVELNDNVFECIQTPMRDAEGVTRGVAGIAIDVTSRKRSENERRQAEDRLVDAIESINEGFVLHDAEGRLILCNSRYREFYPAVADILKPGISMEALIRRNVECGFKPEAMGREEAFIAATYADRMRGDYTAERLLGDGRWILVNDRRTSHGEIVGIRTDITDLKAREAALRTSEERLRTLVETTSDMFWEVDDRWRLTYASQTVRNILGYDPAKVLGKTPLDFMLAEHVPMFRGLFERAITDPHPIKQSEAPCLRQDGKLIVLEHNAAPMFDDDGRFVGYRGMSRDVTERRAAQDQLRKLSQAVEQSPASVVITDRKGNIEYVNPKFEKLTGYGLADVRGRNPRVLKSGNLPSAIYGDLWRTITAGREWKGELHNRKKNGDLFWEQATIRPIKNTGGDITHFLAVKEDITIRKEYEQQLVRQATHDALTGLPNRTLALDRLSQALHLGARENSTVGLIYVDLDRFKLVNDTLGHASGDALLTEASRRLRACLRESDTVARFGGDEFLIILPHLDAAQYSEVVARKILHAFAEPFMLVEQEFFVTASIGVSVYPHDGDTPSKLMRNADAAMYQAKESGRNAFRFFTKAMNVEAEMRLRIESLLHKALERDQFTLSYQPLVDIHSGRPVGAEALLRWHSPELGEMAPDSFVHLAEETGLIVPIGDWVLQKACEDARYWPSIDGQPLWVAVNVSFRQFRGHRLEESVDRALKASDLPPHLLELELTEHMMMEDLPEATATLEKLGRRGVGLAIDDFGTGYSSLGYLNRFPFDVMKIDRIFVSDVTSDPSRAALANAIVALARSFGMRVIGEGVETPAQLDFLKRAGCHWAQGHLFSRPLPLADFREFLDAWTDAPHKRQKIVDR